MTQVSDKLLHGVSPRQIVSQGAVKALWFFAILLGLFGTCWGQCTDRSSLDLVDALSLSDGIKRSLKASGILFSELVEASGEDLAHILEINSLEGWKVHQQLQHLTPVKCANTGIVSRGNAVLARLMMENVRVLHELGSGARETSCFDFMREWYGAKGSTAPAFLAEDAMNRTLGHCWGPQGGKPRFCLPSAQIVGYSHSGSTALAFLLSKHPQVGDQLGHFSTKESNFFRRTGGYDWEAYSQLFLPSLRDDEDILALDGTPEHVYNDRMTPFLMKCHMPWTRVVLILRDPVALLLSKFRTASMITKERQKLTGDSPDERVCFGNDADDCFERQPLEVWAHLGTEGTHELCDGGSEGCGFRSVVSDIWLGLGSSGEDVQYPRRYPIRAKHWHVHHDPRHEVSAFFRGLHLSHWLTVFQHADVHVVFQQELLQDRAAVMRRLESFLGLDAWGNATFDPYAPLDRTDAEQPSWIVRPEQSPNQRAMVPPALVRRWGQFLADDDAVLRALLLRYWKLTPPWDPLGTPRRSVCAELQANGFSAPPCAPAENSRRDTRSRPEQCEGRAVDQHAEETGAGCVPTPSANQNVEREREELPGSAREERRGWAGDGGGWERRFEAYMEHTCGVCRARGAECGCELGGSNPAFQALRNYSEWYARTREDVLSGAPGPYKWVFLRIAGGVGNQLIQFVNAFIMAIATKRLLVLDLDIRSAAGHPGGHSYAFDPVIDVLTLREAQHAMDMDDRVVYNDNSAHSLDFIFCGVWDEELTASVFDFQCGNTAHYTLANVVFGPWLTEAFGSRPFFFLSRFFWSGQRELHMPVGAKTMPFPQAWDGPTTVAKLVHAVKAAGPSLVLGIHARIYSLRPFEYMDHRSLSASLVGSEYKAAFCSGHDASLEDLKGCASSLVSAAVRARGAGPAVVFWATDNDARSAGLLASLLQLEGVLVVRLEFEEGDRFDRHPEQGLLDMALLQEAGAMLGTTASTYSFAAHARGLVPPRYPSFRRNQSDPCGAAYGSEAGMLTRGRGHSRCRTVGPFPGTGCHCAEIREACVDYVQGQLPRCFQDFAPCLENDTAWADPFLIDVDSLHLKRQLWTRRGQSFTADYSFEDDFLESESGCPVPP